LRADPSSVFLVEKGKKAADRDRSSPEGPDRRLSSVIPSSEPAISVMPGTARESTDGRPPSSNRTRLSIWC